MKKFIAVAAMTCGLASSWPAVAHHSFAAEFDGNKPVRLVGVVTKILWTNPHTYFYLDVETSPGSVSNWACEAGNPGALARRGWNRDDVKIGDTLTVEGYLAKDGSRLVDIRRAILPGGRSVHGGTPGDGGPEDQGTDDGASKR